MEDNEIIKLIDHKIAKAMSFATAKYGDTPTDALQLVPKKYVTSVIAASTGIPGGNNYSLQFKDPVTGRFGGSSTLSWVDGTQTLYLGSKLGAEVGIGAIVESHGNVTFSQTGAVSSMTSAGYNFNSADYAPITQASLLSGSFTVDIQTVIGLDDRTGNVFLNANDRTTVQNSVLGGLTYIARISGTPTKNPSDTRAGAMVFDYTNSKLFMWDGSAWKSVTLS